MLFDNFLLVVRKRKLDEGIDYINDLFFIRLAGKAVLFWLLLEKYVCIYE